MKAVLLKSMATDYFFHSSLCLVPIAPDKTLFSTEEN